MRTVPSAMRLLVAIATASLLSACATAGGAAAPDASWPSRGGDSSVIRIGSFDFSESALLAELYGQALEAAGYHVAYYLNLGSREIVDPALEQGFIDLVPEYMGSALAFATLGRSTASGWSVPAARAALTRALAPRHLVALSPARATDANTVVVTARTAGKHDLTAISQLKPLAPRMTFGAPPECMVRDLCLKGLESRYHLRFRGLRPLDASGTYVIDALRSGTIGVGILFTTDPRLDPGRQGKQMHLVQLRDDLPLQPPENVVPVLRRSVLDTFGPGAAAALDAVSARLTTVELTSLNVMVTFGGRAPADVAGEWLRRQGIL
jgi:osmoprotectant transport system substrate-binding protein